MSAEFTRIFSGGRKKRPGRVYTKKKKKVQKEVTKKNRLNKREHHKFLTVNIFVFGFNLGKIKNNK